MNRQKRIRDLRCDNDFTQQQIGEQLDCSRAVYCDYERGRTRIPSDKLIELALFYHTSVDYLLNLTDEKCPYLRTDAWKEQNDPEHGNPCSANEAHGVE